MYSTCHLFLTSWLCLLFIFESDYNIIYKIYLIVLTVVVLTEL